MLSSIAQQMAAEIAQHDWSDAPYRADRAGHNREHDSNRQVPQLDERQTVTVRLNVIWVTAQVLAYNDPNFDIVEYARVAGDKDTKTGWLTSGLRRGGAGRYHRPGTYDEDTPELAKGERIVRSFLDEHKGVLLESSDGKLYVESDGRLIEAPRSAG